MEGAAARGEYRLAPLTAQEKRKSEMFKLEHIKAVQRYNYYSSSRMETHKLK